MALPTNLRLLNVKQPWATAIAKFGKDVENRNRPIPGTLSERPFWALILASRNNVTRKEMDDLESRILAPSPIPRDRFPKGAIVCAVKFMGSNQRCTSRWYNQGNDHAWVIGAVVDFDAAADDEIVGGQTAFLKVEHNAQRDNIYALVRRNVPDVVWK